MPKIREMIIAYVHNQVSGVLVCMYYVDVAESGKGVMWL